MKIQTILELIEPQERNFTTNKMFKDRPWAYHKEKNNPVNLGDGNFSKVRKTKDPHVVKKSSIQAKTGNPEVDDAYWDFVDLILRNKLWENPYFPRIYKKTSLKGANDTGHSSVEMEKLESIENASKDEILPMLRKTLNKTGREYVAKASKSSRKRSAWADSFALVLDMAIETGNVSYIKDEELIKALKILHRHGKKTGALPDLHSENIMGRRTPYGLQLVLADPFSFQKSS